MSALDGWIDVCRTGTWRDMRGREVAVDDALLDTLAAGYPDSDPAPVVVGHPKTNAPAFGWVEGLRKVGDRLQAKLSRIEPAFRQAVEAGRYAGRSIHFRGGKLVHLGFLGGQAPAVPGLAPTHFSAAEDDAATVISFAAEPDGIALADWQWIGFRSMASIARAFRDYIIEKEDLEAADRVIPSWEIDSLERAARDAEDNQRDTARFAGSPSCPEPENQPTGQEDPLTGAPDAAALAAQKTELDGRASALDSREAALAAKEASANAADRVRKAEAAIEPHIQAGRVLPTEKAGLTALLASFDDGDDAAVSFAAPDGSGTVREQPAAILERFIGALPKRVPYGELAGGPAPSVDGAEDNAAIAAEAEGLLAAARRDGVVLTAAQAVSQVRAKRGLPN